ncbi:TetR/AcrR family transcriptional regulator C-terminal domain-containing protein [Nocardia sp. NPDC052112]|uniref:TetR/AcrR family transcriptional regulator C-terminal domain-containing protein n=1 Tax=Nocardia sp. NPDC052112 TaxID=3155646 RepID=UPI003445ABB7
MSKPKPTTRIALNRDYIAATALTVIDTAGLDGFTMRKLGTALGADPMAAYRHFTDQQDLFDGIAEAMFDELEMETLPWQQDWPELMSAYAHRLRSTLRRHPNAVPIFATRPVRSAAAIETGNWMLERLQGVGFTPAVALQFARCLREYVVGHILSHTVAAVAAQRSRKPTPSTPDYNTLAAAADATANTDHFDIGLTAMLDGFRRLLTEITDHP